LPLASATGVYDPKDYDFVRAYLVLAHAEVEQFLEELAVDVLVAAQKRWDATRAAGRCLSALLMYDDKQTTAPPSLAKQKTDDTLSMVASRAIRKHEEFIVQKNHGVKEGNLLRMLLPIGVLETDLDPIWLVSR